MRKNKAIFVLILAIVSLLSLGIFTACNSADSSADAHNFGSFVPAVNATCTKDGHICYKKCTDCGKYFDEFGKEVADIVIKAKGHTFGEWVVTKKADETTVGEKQRTCSACNYVEKEDIPMIVVQTFSITYNLNGGTAMSENPTSYSNSDEDFAISNVFKRGYVFSGWAVNGGEPKVNYVISYGTEGNLTFEAVFREDKTVIYDGETVDLVPDAVRKYLESDDKAKYLYEYQANYAIAKNPKALKFAWTNAFGAKKFTLKIFSDEEMTKEILSVNVGGSAYNLYNPIPGETYYYSVTDENGNLIKIDYVKLKEGLRTINCDNISNMRDMGGYITPDGMISYGLIYRSPEIVNVTSKGLKTMVEQLGIKTEIDLRLGSTTQTVDESIQKYVLGFWQWDYIFPGMNSNRPYSSSYTDNIAQIFRLFADKKNYPIVFHCSAGADRTGTIAFLLNGLLGASYEDLASDFEITSFYMGKRWRSDIQVVNGVYSFTEDGIMQDNPDNLVDFNKAYNHIMQTYAGKDGTLSGAIENYLKSVVKLTDLEISSIKHIMLSTSEHVYGDWVVTEKGSCKKEGVETRYCACGKYETRVIPVTGHVYGDWNIVTQPSVGVKGLKERFCECGDRQTEEIPALVQTKYDFGGNNGLDVSVNAPGISESKLVAVKIDDKTSLPDGYEGEVCSKNSDYLVSVGVGFNTEYKVEDLISVKVRLCVQSDSVMSKGNFRLYDDKENAIRVDDNFTKLSGVYNEWVEIDLLPLIKSYKGFTVNGILQKFCIVVRTGVAATVSFDSVTVTAYGN